MVGVPGKYKGCETCRRRRVKVGILTPVDGESQVGLTTLNSVAMRDHTAINA
jgi:hypothetical protein